MDEGVQQSPSFQDYYWVLILILVIIVGLSFALFWYIRYCRRLPHHEYTALEDDALLHNRMEMERKLHADTDKNMAVLYCQYYMRESQRYVFIKQLFNMGSRRSKYWFLVKDTATKTERLLTMTSISENCPVKYNTAVRRALLDLLSALQHPYIYPVLDIDRKVIMEQEFVITVVPYNENGTLKDLIYSDCTKDKWKNNYHFGGLKQSQTQRLGCQVLEALLCLKDQRFPPFVYLHSGNVILQNGVARISGLENLLLGYTSHHYLLIPKKLYDNKETSEVICFGHLIFEMAAGYKLRSCFPSESNYNDVEKHPQTVDVLRFIFEQGRNSFPTLREIANLEFFRHIDLRELQSHVPMYAFRNKLSPEARSLMKEIRKHQKPKKRNKRSQSMSTIETASVDSSKESSGSSWSVKKKKKKRVLTSSETTPDQLFTQMRTMPLPDIEGSVSIAFLQSSEESRGDQLFSPEEQQQRPLLHSQMLEELHAAFMRKQSYDNQNPEV